MYYSQGHLHLIRYSVINMQEIEFNEWLLDRRMDVSLDIT